MQRATLPKPKGSVVTMAAKIAAHLNIARIQGAQAGMLAYLGTPISKLSSQHYSTIMGKRTDNTRLAAYCNAFGISQKAAPITPVYRGSKASLEAQIEALQAQINGVEVDPLVAMQAKIDELTAMLAGKAPVAAKPRLIKPRPWDLTGKNVDSKGIFVNKGVKYRALTFEEAVEALEACYTANVRYTVRAS